jgi:uncharacterized protein YuzE
MRVRAFPETRTIYVSLVDGATSVDTEEIADGVVVDYDAGGKQIGVEIELDMLPEYRALHRADERNLRR